MCGDEGLELTDGYFYWSGDVITHPPHAPLAKGLFSLPLRLEGARVQWPNISLKPEERSYLFLKVWNVDRFERWLWEARGVALIFGLFMGAAIAWGVQRRPKAVQWAALTLWAFEPTVLGFSVVVQADIALAAVFAVSVLMWVEVKDRIWSGWFLGVAVGVSTCIKLTGITLFPILMILEWNSVYMNQEGFRTALIKFIKIVSGFLATVGLVYGVATLKLPGHPLPWVLYIKANIILLSLHWQSVFFLGTLSTHNTFWYFPVAWILKSGVGYLVLLGLTPWILKKGEIPLWMWFPPLLFLLAHIRAQNVGVRYLLPCTPFLIWIAAEGVGKLWDGVGRIPRRSTRALAITLLLGQVASTALSFPNHIGYFNDLVPKSAKKYLLADSNLDIGQDTGRMIRKLDELGLCKTKIAYFGGPPPVVCGNVCNRWRVQDAQRPEEGWSYALGVEYEQLGPAYDPDASAITNGWVRNISPDIRVGETWRIWINPASKTPKNQLMKK
jgi:hypothetical protein